MRDLLSPDEIIEEFKYLQESKIDIYVPVDTVYMFLSVFAELTDAYRVAR